MHRVRSLACLALLIASACSSKSEPPAPQADTPSAQPAPHTGQPPVPAAQEPPPNGAKTSGDAPAGPAGSGDFASLTGNASGWGTPEAQAWFELTGEVVEPTLKAKSLAEIESKLKKCVADVALPVYWQSADPKKPQRVLETIPAGKPFGSFSEPTDKRMDIPAPTGKRWVEPPSPPTCAPVRP